MSEKEVVLACDHAGINLKKSISKMLIAVGYSVTDIGTYTEDSMDYPDLAVPFAYEVLTKQIPGIIICGTGIGVSIAANKIKGIRAALCHDLFTAELSRQHNNANVLALGARVLDTETAIEIVNKFLTTSFEGGRHEKRVKKLMALENL